MTKSKTGGVSIFNRVRMGYAVIESRKADAWRLLLGNGLGMQVDVLPDHTVAARMDAHARRLLIVPGPAEDLTTLGLELDDEETLDIVLERLKKRGITVQSGDPKIAEQRGVENLWRFTGPKGMEIELFHQPKIIDTPPRMAASGFITGEKGFGHMAITTRRPDAMRKFWEDIFDIRHSDDVHYTITGVPLIFEFLRLNGRHHSIALAYTPKIKLDPIRTRLQHLEVQVATLDDLGAAYTRCRELELPISMSVGQHANDKAVSFYVQTPSGFDIEYGWNPLEVDESTWKPELWDRISIWGHRMENQTLATKAAQLGRGVASLMRSEFAPAGF